MKQREIWTSWTLDAIFQIQTADDKYLLKSVLSFCCSMQNLSVKLTIGLARIQFLLRLSWHSMLRTIKALIHEIFFTTF